MANVWLIAGLWMALALAGSAISIQTGVSIALVEILVGVVGGNFLGLHTTPWADFLGGAGSIMLTFLAGAEIEPAVLKNKFRESVVIGFISFLAPFLAAMAAAYYLAGWDLRSAEIAGVALSTTSVAVVYAVMLETGLNETELGKIILAACFITDLGTVLALGVLFANVNVWMFAFALGTVAVLLLAPRFTRWLFDRYADRVSQVEAKTVMVLLFVLGGLATLANSEAVLPAYLLGLAMAGVLADRKEVVKKLRVLTFGFLTPFYFLKAGLFVSLPAVIAAGGLIALLFLVKMAAKFAGVWPLALAFNFGPRNGMYTTLLMATGLTFGTISSLYGLTHGIINQTQYTVLVTVVIGSAVIPTLIAQTFFRPVVVTETQQAPSVEVLASQGEVK